MNIVDLFLPKFTMWFAEDAAPAAGGNAAPQGSGDTTPPPANGGDTSGQDANKTVPLAALHEERSKRQELQTEVENLKNLMQNTQQQANAYGAPPHVQQQMQQQQQYQQQQLDPSRELDEMWENNPRNAVNAQIGQAFAYYDNVNSHIESQMTQAATRYKDFNNYREQVRRYVNATPLQDRSKPGVVDVAYYIVKGQNADAAIEQARQASAQQTGAAFQTQGVGNSMPGVPQQGGDGTLSQEEQNVARVMGLTNEEYLANKKG